MIEAEADALLAAVRPREGRDVGAHELTGPDFLGSEDVLPVHVHDAGLVLAPRRNEGVALVVAVIGFLARVAERHLDGLERDVVAEFLLGGSDAGVLQSLVGGGFLLRGIEDQGAGIDGLLALGTRTRREDVGEAEGGVGGVQVGHGSISGFLIYQQGYDIELSTPSQVVISSSSNTLAARVWWRPAKALHSVCRTHQR